MDSVRYKFRAYEKSTGKMYNCYGFNILENEIYIASIAIDDFVEGVLETVHSITNKLNEYVVVQFTGLTDKNGREIYEGDIIMYKWGSDEDYYVESIKWDEYYTGYHPYLDDYSMPNKNTVEVIGNIFENKELLE